MRVESSKVNLNLRVVVVLGLTRGAGDNRSWVARGRLWQSLNKSGPYQYDLPPCFLASAVILPIPIGRSPGQKICCYQHLWSLHLKLASKAIALWAISR
jgi:hypothetical protein